MADYLAYFKEVHAQTQINKLVQKYNNKKIIVYGAGIYFQILQENYDISKLNVVGIADRKFQGLTEENSKKQFGYSVIPPENLKDIDFDIILVALLNNQQMCDYLKYELLINTKNEDKIVLPIIQPTMTNILKSILTGKSNTKELLNFLCQKINRNQYKKYFIKAKNNYTFLRSIMDENNFKTIYGTIETEKEYLKQADLWLKNYKNKDYKKAYKKIQECYRYLKSISDAKYLTPIKDVKLRSFQLKITDFAKEITDFLDKNNLEYFITSGTLIGAVRHSGFIPWDDDFDVGLMRKDYEKLKEIIKENKVIIVDNSLITNDIYNQIDKTIKQYKNKLVCFEGPKYIQFYRGTSLADSVAVDIFPHEYYKDDYKLEDYKKDVRNIAVDYEKIENFDERCKYINNVILNSKNTAEHSNKIYYSYDSLGSYVVNHKKFMEQDKIFPRIKMKFENYEFYAPNNPHEYITVQYENYWDIPDNIEVMPDYKKKLKY